MDNVFQLTLLALGAMFFTIFLYMRIAPEKDRTILNSFPFENNHQKLSNTIQICFSAASTICSIIFLSSFFNYVHINSWMTAGLIVGIISCVAFFVLCFLDFNHLGLRILVNTVFLVTSFLLDVMFAYAYWKIADVCDSSVFRICGIIFIVFAIVRAIPFVFAKAKLKNVADEETGEMKRPAFVELAFFEWIYKILSFVELTILFILLI